jgi:intron-binding protein aquarius
MLVTGELFPSNRVLMDEEVAPVPREAQMENVEHLGQYVYEMTNSKVQQVCISNRSQILSDCGWIHDLCSIHSCVLSNRLLLD